MDTSKALKHIIQPLLKTIIVRSTLIRCFIISSVKTRFEQPSFEAFLKSESFLLQSVNNCNTDDELITFLGKVYSDDLGTDALIVEGVVLKTMLKNCEIKCFHDIYKHIKGNSEC